MVTRNREYVPYSFVALRHCVPSVRRNDKVREWTSFVGFFGTFLAERLRMTGYRLCATRFLGKARNDKGWRKNVWISYQHSIHNLTMQNLAFYKIIHINTHKIAQKIEFCHKNTFCLQVFPQKSYLSTTQKS
jgi:hypothetical protein